MSKMFCQLLMLEGQHLTNYNIDSYWFVSWWKPRKSAYSDINIFKFDHFCFQKCLQKVQSYLTKTGKRQTE